jgi:hypothetical protein
MVISHDDLNTELEFFRSRSRIKNPRPQKKPPFAGAIPHGDEDADLVKDPKKRRRTIGNAYQHTRTGARPDLGGIICRSGWESDVLRVLQLFKIQFEFEPRIFSFPVDKYGKSSAYLPDVWLPKTDEYIEVKGLLDARGRQKLRKFKKYYPDEFSRLTVIISRSNRTNKEFFAKLGVRNVLYYEHISKLFADKIIMWEGKHV